MLSKSYFSFHKTMLFNNKRGRVLVNQWRSSITISNKGTQYVDNFLSKVGHVRVKRCCSLPKPFKFERLPLEDKGYAQWPWYHHWSERGRDAASYLHSTTWDKQSRMEIGGVRPCSARGNNGAEEIPVPQ